MEKKNKMAIDGLIVKHDCLTWLIQQRKKRKEKKGRKEF